MKDYSPTQQAVPCGNQRQHLSVGTRNLCLPQQLGYIKNYHTRFCKS